jgi:hypothetical protein
VAYVGCSTSSPQLDCVSVHGKRGPPLS